MTLQPMTYGEYYACRTLRKNQSGDRYTIQILPYQSEMLMRYLDQTRAMRERLTEQEQDKKIFDHLDQTVEKIVGKAFDDLFKGWK